MPDRNDAWGLPLAVARRALTLPLATAAAVERTALGVLRARLEAHAPEPRAELRTTREVRADAGGRGSSAQDPREVMAGLLGTALQQNTASGRRSYLLAVLGQLVPDEARILAALGEGVSSPTVSIYARGSGKDALLQNASLIGRDAAVTVPSMTPRYVTHLLNLGLLEVGAEDTTNGQGYELLLSERAVREALKAGEMGKLPARIERRTVRLSAHGVEVWEATRPAEPGSGDAE